MSQEKKQKQENGLDSALEKTEDTVFKFLGFFFLTKSQLEKTKEKIKHNSKSNFNYVLLTVFSVLVIVFGMIIDSTAVVIGGMLIAPLFWPILAFAVGVVDGDVKMVTSSFLVLMKSLLIIIGISILIGVFAPRQVLEAAEFVSRTTPTVYDLLIGLLAGFLGAYIVAHPKMTSSFGGVVIAAALVPPIAVMGVALIKGDFDSFGGAFLLTIASLVSMTFTATLLFYIGRIQTRKRKTLLSAENIAWFVFALLIVLVPLVVLTQQIIRQQNHVRIVNTIAEKTFPDASVVDSTLTERSGIANVHLVVHRADQISDDQIEAVASAISQELGQSVVLDIRVVPVVEKQTIVTY